MRLVSTHLLDEYNVRRTIIDRRYEKSRGFELRYSNFITDLEVCEWARDNFYLILGGWCAGKDTVQDELQRLGVMRIPLLKSDRSLRPGEEIGRELIPASRYEIKKKRREGDLMIEYLVNAGIPDREQVAGIDLSLVYEAKEKGVPCAGIFYPNAAQFMIDWIDPLIFVIWATPQDRKKMLKSRGVSDGFIHRFGKEQNILGGWSDDVYLPGHRTHFVRNRWGAPWEAAEEILRLAKEASCE
ncbi:MAG: hypothetical protein WC107_06835 [Patescibacteria group bacterium]